VPQEPLKGPRGSLKGPRRPFRGPWGPLGGHPGPFKDPRWTLNGPRRHFKGWVLMPFSAELEPRHPPRSPSPAPQLSSRRKFAAQSDAKARVTEGNLAGDFRAGFRGMFGRTRPPDPPRSPGSAPHINFHEKSTPQTDANSASPRIIELPGPAGRGPGVDFCGFSIAKRAQTAAASRRGGVLGPLSYEKNTQKSTPRPLPAGPGNSIIPKCGGPPGRTPGPVKGPRGPLKGPWGALKGPRGPFSGVL